MTTADKIRSFADIPKGAFYGNSLVITQDVINHALELLQKAEGLNVETNAIPGVDGNIVLIYHYANGWSLNFDIQQGGNVDFYLE